MCWEVNLPVRLVALSASDFPQDVSFLVDFQPVDLTFCLFAYLIGEELKNG